MATGKTAKAKNPRKRDDTAKNPRKRGEAPRTDSAARAAFDIAMAKLPEAIDKAAFRSGDYPYAKKLKRKPYEAELQALQIELLKLQNWVKETGARVVIVFEGRDGAGKGGTIHRFNQHMNPRNARIVALSKPSDTEKGQWYFQRYAAQMPTRGEIVFFDRSWYNRAVVEPVMGFCTPAEHEAFLTEAPAFEGMLARDGIHLFKLFLTIGAEMQMKRLHARFHDPLKRWKLSPIDFEAITRFDAYSGAFETMLERTDSPTAPWTVIRANDKLRARLNAIRFVLNALPYADKNEEAVKGVDRRIAMGSDAFLRCGGEEEAISQDAP
ncbi:MAG: polyphosphate kinase 2 [Bosea sp.]|jgi:polyphosphate kinase 2|nr:polyphosphate kinase 2 [Bosea sp. (in: a-proteobacteria)]